MSYSACLTACYVHWMSQFIKKAKQSLERSEGLDLCPRRVSPYNLCNICPTVLPLLGL
jgi:hypothetical protein